MSIQPTPANCTNTGAFFPWGFWFNGQDVHVDKGVKSLRDQSYVVSKRDSHGDISHFVAIGKDIPTVRQRAILASNLGFSEANTYTAEIGDNFWTVLGEWLEWKQTQPVTISAIRVWFSDGRVEDVGSVPQ